MMFWVCLTMGQRMPPICAWEIFRHWIKDQDLHDYPPFVCTVHLLSGRSKKKETSPWTSTQYPLNIVKPQ